ncbi:MAG: Flp pilus assembly complex ATPase component TadA [bacterium]|nr:Flp pilus assembly complex ATPase component TadA [bacterium]
MGPGLNGRRALLRFLQRRGHLTPVDTQRLEQATETEGLAVADLLAREGLVPEADLATVLADALKLRRVEPAGLTLAPAAVGILKDALALQHEVLPIALDDRRVELAMANPLDLDAIKAVEFATGKRVTPLVAPRGALCEAIAAAYRIEDARERFGSGGSEPEQPGLVALEDEAGADLRTIAGDADLPPVAKLADMILIEGTRAGASEVHLESGPDGPTLRYRVDGILEEGLRFPKWVESPLMARLKVMAKLDLTERRVPQDGRLQVRWQGRTLDVRVSSLPTPHGEEVTLRILDATRAVRSMEDLGLPSGDLGLVREAIAQPQGMVLVTGPTGSGRTTTLCALAREIVSPARAVVALESPIAYQRDGMRRVEADESRGLTVAGVLRRDPAVVLAGEMRDAERARIAFEAVQTGHLVLSTLHANDAASAVTRLIDLGISPSAVASSVTLLMAQRLVRCVCRDCAGPHEVPDDVLDMLGLQAQRGRLRCGRGCRSCRGTGYSGRIGVHEVLPVGPAIGRIIAGDLGESELRRQARRESRRTLREDAIAKIAAGVTTPEEVLRVVQVPTDGADEPAPTEPMAAPRSAVPAAGPVSDPPRAPAASRAAAQRPARTFRALVAGDEPSLRQVVRLMLETAKLGLVVLTAQDGEEALAMAALERPDVVVLDGGSRGMDGVEVRRRLRADPATAVVPILMLTRPDAPELLAGGGGAGADDYLPKPVRRETLLARVRPLLERTFGRDAVPAAPGTPAAAESL